MIDGEELLMKNSMMDQAKLESLLRTGKLRRREFIEAMAAIGLTAAIPGAFRRVEAQTPKRGGRLRVGTSGSASTDNTDPGHGSCCSAHTNGLLFILRNTLTMYSADGTIQPELAESWESTPDAVQWTFKLRQGVEFHNGKTMEAEDVVFSINRHRGPDSSSPASGIVAQITDIKADGKDKVVVTLVAGNADLPALMSDYHLVVTTAGTTDWSNGMGTGPFKLVSHEPGVRLLAERHPNYFREGLPYFDEIENLGINDATTKTQALKTGELDLIDHPDMKLMDLLKQTPGLQVITAPGFRHYTMPMRCVLAPYDNNDIRLGLKYIVPRQQLLDVVLRGYGVLGNDHPISTANRYHNGDLPQRDIDADKAKFHLKKAGADALEFQLHTSDAAFGGCVDASVLIAEAASKAGINVKVVREPADGYWNDVWRVKPWTWCYWSGRPTEDWMFSTAYADDAAWNDADWKNVRFNELLRKARTELEEKPRREMYYEMQAIVRDEGGTIVPLFADQVAVATDKVKFKTPISGHYEFDGQRAYEGWCYGLWVRGPRLGRRPRAAPTLATSATGARARRSEWP
jgi:peptide/nickel transport system substrate-binding protein